MDTLRSPVQWEQSDESYLILDLVVHFPNNKVVDEDPAIN